MRIVLPFSYDVDLQQTRRHRPFRVRVRQASPFEVPSLDELPDFHETYGVAERRFIAAGTVYRAVTKANAEVDMEAYSVLVSVDGPAIVSIGAIPCSEIWWTDAYGHSPPSNLACPLQYPTLRALREANGWEHYIVHYDGAHGGWSRAWMPSRENIGILDGNVFVATAEPVWAVDRKNHEQRVSLVFSESPTAYPAHDCFAIGKRALAMSYASSFAGFDGNEPEGFDWMPIDRRIDTVAMARSMMGALLNLRKAAAMLGDAEYDGESCYRILTHIDLRKPELNGSLADAAVGAVWALQEAHAHRMALYLLPDEYSVACGIHRRVGFERALDRRAIEDL